MLLPSTVYLRALMQLTFRRRTYLSFCLHSFRDSVRAAGERRDTDLRTAQTQSNEEFVPSRCHRSSTAALAAAAG